MLLPGEHLFHVPEQQVRGLLRAFDRAEFFELKDEYRFPIVDIPTSTLSLEVDGQIKVVVDHLGVRAGMPQAVVLLEERIDSLAGIGRWLVGNEETISYS